MPCLTVADRAKTRLVCRTPTEKTVPETAGPGRDKPAQPELASTQPRSACLATAAQPCPGSPDRTQQNMAASTQQDQPRPMKSGLTLAARPCLVTSQRYATRHAGPTVSRHYPPCQSVPDPDSSATPKLNIPSASNRTMTRLPCHDSPYLDLLSLTRLPNPSGTCHDED